MTVLDAEVGVVGLGTMGSMAAWQLSRRGVSVLGFEQFRIGHELGAGVGEARQFRPNYLEPAVQDVMPHAEREYRALEAVSGLSLLTMTGGLTIGSERSPEMAELLRRIDEDGDRPILIGRSEMSDRFPQHVLADDDIVVWNEQSGFIRPELSIAAASSVAQAAGAELLEGCAITSVEPFDGHVELRSGERSWRVGRVIITAGPWVWRLLRRDLPAGDLGRLLITWFPTRRPDEFRIGRFPIFTRYTDGVTIYGLPSQWEGTARVGFAGPRSRFEDPDELDRQHVPAEEIARIEAIVGRLMPGLIPTVVRTGTHLDSYTSDGQPLVGAIDAAGMVTVGAAFAGRGFKMAPVLGRILADLAVDGGTDLEISAWRPDRFGAAGLIGSNLDTSKEKIE